MFNKTQSMALHLGGLFSLGLLAACGTTPPDDLTHPLATDVSALSESWATYTIPVGAHSASVSGAQPQNPIAWFTTVAGRDFQFRLNPSAIYVLTSPTQPDDQLDWNKLPGFSDCGTLDLSADGAMFGWRWRLDKSPRVLEITAYANNAGKHLTPAMPLLTLDEDDLRSDAALRYRVWIDKNQYRFAVTGTVRTRTIAATTTLPRRCAAHPATGLKWASGLYFGGTSTAPSKITGRISEIRFSP